MTFDETPFVVVVNPVLNDANQAWVDGVGHSNAFTQRRPKLGHMAQKNLREVTLALDAVLPSAVNGNSR